MRCTIFLTLNPLAEINKNINNIMKQKSSGLNKITQIICLSNDYLSHKKNLRQIKGLVDHSSPKRNTDINEYLSRKGTYREVRKSLKEKSITRENEKLVQRLTDITDKRADSRASVRSDGSLTRTISERVTGYKTRRNFIKKKEVEEQNSRMNERIKNAHFKNGLSPRNYTDLRKENSSYKKVHSRFSDRSQSQMK